MAKIKEDIFEKKFRAMFPEWVSATKDIFDGSDNRFDERKFYKHSHVNNMYTIWLDGYEIGNDNFLKRWYRKDGFIQFLLGNCNGKWGARSTLVFSWIILIFGFSISLASILRNC